jgi:hypothetical protein
MILVALGSRRRISKSLISPVIVDDRTDFCVVDAAEGSHGGSGSGDYRTGIEAAEELRPNASPQVMSCAGEPANWSTCRSWYQQRRCGEL